MLPEAKKSVAFQKYEIDFILCTRNRVKNIFDLLGSINNLVGSESAAVTIVDSSDDPIQLDPNDFQKIGKINLVHTTPGLPSQRNIGLLSTVNPIIIFLDDDVLLETNFITATVHQFESNLALAGIGYLLKGVDYVPKKISKRFSLSVNVEQYGQVTRSGKNYWYPEKGEHHNFKPPMWLPGCAMAFRRAQLEGVRFNTVLERGILGGYALGEDVDFTLRLQRIGKNFGLCLNTMVNHYEAPGARDNPRQLARAEGHWLKYLAKSHRSHVFKLWVFLRLFTEFIYLLVVVFIFRGNPIARVCSGERLLNFLRSGPYSKLN